MFESSVINSLSTLTVLGTILLPLVGFLLIGGRVLVGQGCSESNVRWISRISLFSSLFCLLGLIAISIIHGGGELSIQTIPWFSFQGEHFNIDFIVDGLSLIFLGVTSCLTILTADFSESYLHQDPGFTRFFMLLLLACFGINVVIVSDHLGLTIIGWECLGIASALLVAFFHTRNSPVKNAINIFSIYRVADLGLLGALMLSHHWVGEPTFQAIRDNATTLSSTELLILGGCLAASALGKCSLLPFPPWLPRAMEGPTPSSALFYGAFSVHAGPYLLLRASPVWDASPILSNFLVGLGLISVIFFSLLGRVRSDIKTSLAYATLVQISFIVVEIGLHWYNLAVLHTVGNICLRTYQFLRAPSAIHDLHVQAKVGVPVSDRDSYGILTSVPGYRFALHEGGVFNLYIYWLVEPFLSFARYCSKFERRMETTIEVRVMRIFKIQDGHEVH